MALMSMMKVDCRARRPFRNRTPSSIDAESEPGGSADRQQGAHGQEGDDGGAEGSDVEPVGGGDTDPGDEDPGQQGTDRRADLKGHLLEGGSSREKVPGDNARHDRRARR